MNQVEKLFFKTNVTFILFSLFLIFFSSPLRAQISEANDENPLQASIKIIPFEINSNQTFHIEISLNVLEGYKAYAHMFDLKLKDSQSSFKLGSFNISPLTEFFDETSKKLTKGLIGKGLLTAPMEAPSILNQKKELTFLLTYQACTKTYCLFPKTIEVVGHFNWLGEKSFLQQAKQPSTWLSELWVSGFNFEKSYSENNLFFLLFSLFILGILTSFTPCIYPLIPITLSVLGKEAKARNKRQNFIAANIYVFGMAFTYALLGLLAASSGKLFGATMNSPWVMGLVCLVFLVMSLSSFGLFEIQLPSRLQIILQSNHGKGYLSVFITGIISGLVAGPCVGPVLVGVLTFIAQTQNLWIGFWSLFVFALGMGQLLLVIGTSSSLVKLLPQSGPWMNGIKTFFGLIMLGLFYYYLKNLVPLRVWEGLLGLGFILFGSFKLQISKSENEITSRFENFRNGLTLSILLFGTFLIFWSVMNLSQMMKNVFVFKQSEQQVVQNNQWINYSKDQYEKALKSNSPMIIDFYADWCAACHELDNKVFKTKEFLEAAKDITLFRFDATKDSQDLNLLKSKYKIVGLPTIVFYDKSGVERKDLQVNEFLPLNIFLEKLNTIKN